MAKEKKKTPLNKNSIFIPLGILYEEDIPPYHIEGQECTKMQYQMYLDMAETKLKTFQKSKALKKLAIKVKEKINNEK